MNTSSSKFLQERCAYTGEEETALGFIVDLPTLDTKWIVVLQALVKTTQRFQPVRTELPVTGLSRANVATTISGLVYRDLGSQERVGRGIRGDMDKELPE